MLTDDGWLRTGDLARKGPLGLVFFAGRQKDVILHGGFTVYATEVERALEQHPDVLEAAVLGLPDEQRGEVPVGRRCASVPAARSPRTSWSPGPASGCPATRRRARPHRRRPAPHRHRQGPEGRARGLFHPPIRLRTNLAGGRSVR